MNPTWSLGGKFRERLVVTLAGPAADDEGYRWVPATVELSVGGFDARISMMLTVDDIQRFADQL